MITDFLPHFEFPWFATKLFVWCVFVLLSFVLVMCCVGLRFFFCSHAPKSEDRRCTARGKIKQNRAGNCVVCVCVCNENQVSFGVWARAHKNNHMKNNWPGIWCAMILYRHISRFVLFCTVHTHAHARTHSHTPHVADDGVFTVPLNPQYSRKCDSLRGDVCGIYACARVLSARAHTYADNVHCTLDICVHSITTTTTTHFGVIVITMIVINKLLIFANYASVFTKCVVIVCMCARERVITIIICINSLFSSISQSFYISIYGLKNMDPGGIFECIFVYTTCATADLSLHSKLEMKMMVPRLLFSTTLSISIEFQTLIFHRAHAFYNEIVFDFIFKKHLTNVRLFCLSNKNGIFLKWVAEVPEMDFSVNHYHFFF